MAKHTPVSEGDTFWANAGRWKYRVVTAQDGWVTYTVISDDPTLHGRKGLTTMGDFLGRIGQYCRAESHANLN